MKLIVMIPCYNEEKTLGEVLKSIPKKIAGITKIETLVVDDGSTDKSLIVAKKFHATHIVRHKRNKGLGETFRDGRDAALHFGADIIVTIDGDGQFDASEIPLLTTPILQEKADMVTGSRFLTKRNIRHMSRLKYIGNKWFTGMVNVLVGRTFTDTQCGFRAYSRDAALRLVLYGGFTYTQEVFLTLVDLGLIVQEVPISVKYFLGRKSKISGSLWGYARSSIGIIARTTRDVQPLKFFGIPAVISIVSGIALETFMFIRLVVLQKT
jgi:glycosyltransferase involved in cell wall biosynthesis